MTTNFVDYAVERRSRRIAVQHKDKKLIQSDARNRPAPSDEGTSGLNDALTSVSDPFHDDSEQMVQWKPPSRPEVVYRANHDKQKEEQEQQLIYCCAGLYYRLTREYKTHLQSKKRRDHKASFPREYLPVCCASHITDLTSFRNHLRVQHSRNLPHYKQEVDMFKAVKEGIIKARQGLRRSETVAEGECEKLDYRMTCCGYSFDRVVALETHLDNVHREPEWALRVEKLGALEQAKMSFYAFLDVVRRSLPECEHNAMTTYAAAQREVLLKMNTTISQWNQNADLAARRVFAINLSMYEAAQNRVWGEPGSATTRPFYRQGQQPHKDVQRKVPAVQYEFPGAFQNQLLDMLKLDRSTSNDETAQDRQRDRATGLGRRLSIRGEVVERPKRQPRSRRGSGLQPEQIARNLPLTGTVPKGVLSNTPGAFVGFSVHAKEFVPGVGLGAATNDTAADDGSSSSFESNPPEIRDSATSAYKKR